MKRPRPSPSITTDEWLAELQRVQGATAPPPGFHTRAEIQQRIGKSRTTTVLWLAQAVRDGCVEVRVFTRVNALGVKIPTPHYRLVKKGGGK